ncbi:hypothetical protein FB45DRAFT_886455 [Roridomyces roridus]|uniref:BTB domain-containing protein n=1 Tax=Roridomyces roridus TaxID=1738132 RepID=A0AAD7CIH4_9AGAR|nr:hypothetical protein FB45DRAFT_886455 [Roridomyces roridus]
MSDSPPPAKRQRPDDQEIVRSEVWYDDGSVVLQASATQFRVHWSVLSSHSSFFRDMQGLSQPQDEPKVEGCPIVELPDSAQDVETVLKALYNPFLFAKKSLPLSVIASHIRLGRKYDMKEFLQTMVQRLADEHPQTLEEYGILIDLLAVVRENNLFALLPSAYLRVMLSSTQYKPIF